MLSGRRESWMHTADEMGSKGNHERSLSVLLALLFALAMVCSATFVLGFRVPPALAASECTKYADSINGNDANSGLAGAPVKTVQKLENRLVAGDVGCIRGGTGQVYDWVKPTWTVDNDLTLFVDVPNTSAAVPVTIRNEPGYPRPLLRGAIQIKSPFVTLQYLNLNGYNLNGNNDPNGTEKLTKPSPMIFADDVKLLNLDVTNPSPGDLSGGVCIHPVGGVLTDTVDRLEIGYSRIHDCGFADDGAKHGHGIYAHKTRNMWIHDNLIYDHPARGIQLRIDADDSVIERNVIDGNQLGIMFSGDNEGDTISTPQSQFVSDNNDVRDNIITYSNPRSNVDSFYPSWNGTVSGVDNMVRDNCILNAAYLNTATQGKAFNGTGYTRYGNLLGGEGSEPDVDPRFVDRAAKNFNLRSDSPCMGKGPSYIQPPVVSTSSITSTDNDAWLSSASSTSYPVPATSLARNASTTTLTVERTLYSGKYYVRGAELRFDTSGIPADAEIEGATLTLYPTGVSTANSRSLAVEWFKDWTGTSSDWTGTASASAGSVPLAAITPDQPVSIPLRSAPVNVNRAGYTDFRLHVDGGQPSGLNKVVIAGYGSTVGQPARLEVSYRPW
jgi:hypothetical protein